MPKLPRRHIHANFREAFSLSNVRATDLAASAGFSQTELSRVMNAPAVVASPRTVERLTVVAGLLWYPGPLFTEVQP